uniref:Uncharacterized protein n=1 Tax=Pelusios castaneus TaxID=367368 RepID=A0A8C8SIR2_9SAUR
SPEELEPGHFPIQKGSLERLKQQWESGDGLRAGPPGGSAGSRRLRRSQAPEGRGVCPAPAAKAAALREEEIRAAAAAGGQEGRVQSRPPEKSRRGSSTMEVAKEEPRGDRRKLERFPIPWEELRSRFEAPSGAAAAARQVSAPRRCQTRAHNTSHMILVFKDYFTERKKE